MPRTVHIAGAGLAGLSAAVALTGRGFRVRVHEATNQAGGRCRSYHDPQLDMAIDNGNHLLLSGNRAALAYLDAVGARDKLAGPGTASVPFMDLKSGERWTLHANDGAIPWWIFVPSRRVPGTSPLDYLAILKLTRATPEQTIGDVLDCQGTLYDKLLEPFLVAALNTEPKQSSASLAAAVMRETMLAGGRNYHPLIAHDGLSTAFVEPGLKYIEAHGGSVSFGQRVRALNFDGNRVASIDVGETIPLAEGDSVILAVPPVVAGALVPGMPVPSDFRAIVNAHYKIEPPKGLPTITGVINGLVEWLFAFEGRLSVTISNADRLLDTPREELAATIWADVAKIAGVAAPLPPWQIVRERRATFAALPREDAKRPGARTRWGNLALAGDWTATGLPATIEGAIRSGNRAADLISKPA